MKLNTHLRTAFIRAAMQDVPNIDHSEKIRVAVQKDAVAQLPAKVRAVHQDASLRHFIVTANLHLHGQYINIPVADRYAFKLSAAVEGQCSEWHKEGKAQDAVRQALETKLTAVANSCTTRKQLMDMLPEFSKYLPEDEAAANRSVPVIANVVSEFVKAGWPKGHRAKSAAAR